MLQRSSLPPAISTEITDSLQQTFNRHWLELLQEVLWLPENYRQYLFVLTVSLIVGAGMMTHVWLNVQIAEQQHLARTLIAQRQQIERENSEIIYAIANATSLRQIERSALMQGYRPVLERKYIRRDELTGSNLPGMANSPTQPVLQVTGGQVVVERVSARTPQSNELIDAIGRALRAAGEWLGQQAGAAAGAVDDLSAGFTERWMR